MLMIQRLELGMNIDIECGDVIKDRDNVFKRAREGYRDHFTARSQLVADETRAGKQHSKEARRETGSDRQALVLCGALGTSETRPVDVICHDAPALDRPSTANSRALKGVTARDNPLMGCSGTCVPLCVPGAALVGQQQRLARNQIGGRAWQLPYVAYSDHPQMPQFYVQ